MLHVFTLWQINVDETLVLQSKLMKQVMNQQLLVSFIFRCNFLVKEKFHITNILITVDMGTEGLKTVDR